MRKLLGSWLFFTALLLFMVLLAMYVPALTGEIFGDTERVLSDAFARAEVESRQVWAAISP